MKPNFANLVVAGFAIFNTINATPLHTRQAECPVGQVYYVCANGYKGCFGTDVCSLPATSCDPKGNPPILPEMHNIYIYPGITPFPSRARIFNIYKQTGNGATEQQQIAVFRGIPPTAKTCTIGAQIAAERSFSVYDNGLMNVNMLTKLPDGAITVDTIHGFDSNRPVTQFNFQFWPETPGPRVLNRMEVPCAAELYLRLSIADEVVPGNGGPGAITLEQDANNGFYLEYTC